MTKPKRKPSPATAPVRTRRVALLSRMREYVITIGGEAVRVTFTSLSDAGPITTIEIVLADAHERAVPYFVPATVWDQIVKQVDPK